VIGLDLNTNSLDSSLGCTVSEAREEKRSTYATGAHWRQKIETPKGHVCSSIRHWVTTRGEGRMNWTGERKGKW
jgi:hypothetical protein